MVVFPWREKLIRDNFIETSFKDEGDFKPNFELFKTLTSAEQYYLADLYNWDDGVEVLKWIIESPKCDKGTAGLIFWRSEPDFYIQRTYEAIPDYEKDTFNLLQLITQRFNQNNFKSDVYRFEPGSSLKYINFNQDYPGWNLPSELQFPNNGKTPFSFGLLRNYITEYQRKQMLKSRETRKNKKRK